MSPIAGPLLMFLGSSFLGLLFFGDPDPVGLPFLSFFWRAPLNELDFTVAVNFSSLCFSSSISSDLSTTVTDFIRSCPHLTYGHPKLLGRCYDNVYHQGQLIGDLPAHGKLPVEAQTKKIYDQEYEEVIARIENSLNLTLQSPSYSVVPTSLLNLDIILPLRMYWEQQGLPAPPPGPGPGGR